MFTPVSLSEKLLFSTLRIEAFSATGIQSVGTGFCFTFRIDNQRNLPVIVTNKHVVAGAAKGRLCFHEVEHYGDIAKPSGKFIPISLDEFETRWVFHPKTNVDLCAMFLNPIVSEIKDKLNKEIYTTNLDESLIQTDSQLESLSAVEDVLMIGYPIGLWDRVNNLPIARRGITASHPTLDFNGESTTVIDAACFPGSSGSPVLVVNEGGYGTKEAFVAGHRAILLGILYGGPIHNLEGYLELKPIPTNVEPRAVVPTMVNLGFIVKAKELLVLGDTLRKQASL